MIVERKIQEVCRYYDAKYRRSNKNYARMDRRHVDYFTDPYRADIMRYEDTLRTSFVSMYEVDIPEDSLEKLIDVQYEYLRNGGIDFRWVEEMRAKEELEHRIRSTNPAVKKAYENYSMLLNMVKDEYK